MKEYKTTPFWKLWRQRFKCFWSEGHEEQLVALVNDYKRGAIDQNIIIHNLKGIIKTIEEEAEEKTRLLERLRAAEIIHEIYMKSKNIKTLDALEESRNKIMGAKNYGK